MSRRPSLQRLSQQPEPASSLAGATVSSARAIPPKGARINGSDVDRVSATGDHPGGMVDVGADFFTAAELAALKLPGLPQRREHVSRLASRQEWSHRQREGRGGGREFALTALPEKARNEILRRRLLNASSNEGARAVAPTIDNLTASQAARLSARALVLAEFDRFRDGRSLRSTLPLFVAAVDAGAIALPDWVAPHVRRMSTRTLRRWHDARADDDTKLAGAGRRGPLPVLDRSGEAADWLIGALIDQPHQTAERFAEFLAIEFPMGVPDGDGLLMPRPGARAVGRFLHRWKSDPLNRQTLVMLSDPDRWKSHYRFAGGNASAGIVRLNQRWQIDASPADVLLTDGRYSIYVVIDVFSRRMMGLVTRTPKTTASLLLVARACEIWGIPEFLITDNGSDFVSLHFVDAIRRLGVAHVPMPPYSPEKKAFIERGIGTVQRGLMAMLPGFVGHNVAQRSKIEARRSFAERLGETDANLFSVALTGSELQERLDAWLINVYARRPHAGLGGITPEVRALQGAEAHAPKFANAAAIGMLLMQPANDGGVRVVSKKGVAVGGLDYWCDGLLVGQRVQVRLDPADLGRIYLYTDTNPWMFVGIAINPDVAGIDRAELASRVRATQDRMLVDARAQARAFRRATNLPAVVERLIGSAPTQLPPPADAERHETPDLVEAAIAATAEGARPSRPVQPVTPEQEDAHRIFVADFQSAREARQLEETGEERYARWKRLKEIAEAGGEISPDSRAWFDRYATLSECKSFRLMEEEFGA
ncbi:MAG: DDE-type integrase/transposase/recombinase [Alphaproteobacteria bacterium]|nr:DDE-type integrase/transposase/recombinase [Alphaproteobacteria bacterium]